MSDTEARIAMRKGEKVTHDYFTDDEYIFMRDGQIVSEDGVVHTQFWVYHQGSRWQQGWSIYKPK